MGGGQDLTRGCSPGGGLPSFVIATASFAGCPPAGGLLGGDRVSLLLLPSLCGVGGYRLLVDLRVAGREELRG